MFASLKLGHFDKRKKNIYAINKTIPNWLCKITFFFKVRILSGFGTSVLELKAYLDWSLNMFGCLSLKFFHHFDFQAFLFTSKSYIVCIEGLHGEKNSISKSITH